MFKALKEKVSNEYEKARVNIQSQALNLVNNGTINSLTERAGDNQNNPDVSGRKELPQCNPSVLEFSNQARTLPESTGFSLVDLDDDNDRSQSSSTQTVAAGATPRTQPPKEATITQSLFNEDSFFKSKFNSFVSNLSNFVPQSDVESEYESESTHGKSLDNVSKEQLIDHCYRLNDRSRKYRERWSEAVKAYKTTIDERDKLKNVLTETQDKAIRRMNELKEQCTLEQEAKRHLEENLRMVIEEKEEQIKVLQKQFEVLNVGKNSLESDQPDSEAAVSKIERLESVLAKCNESLKSNKEKLDVVMKENESLLIYKNQSDSLKEELEQMKKVVESTNASFVEAKQRLHDELESRKIIIKELKDQLEKRSAEIKHKNLELKTQQDNLKKLTDTLNKNVEAAKSSLLQQMEQENQSKLDSFKADFQNQLDRLKGENDKLKETLTLELGSKAELETRLEKLTDELKQELAANEKKCQELDEQNVKVNELESKLVLAAKQLEEVEAKNHEKTEIRHLKEVGTQVQQKESLLGEIICQTANFEPPAECQDQPIVRELEESTKKIENLETQLSEKMECIEQLEKVMAENQSKMAQLNGQQLMLENENDKLKSILLDKETLIQKLQTECDKSERIADTIRSDFDSLQQEYSCLKQVIDQLGEAKEKLSSQVDGFNSELTRLKNRLLDKFKNEFAQLKMDDATQLSYDELLSAVEKCYDRLLEENETLKDQTGQMESLQKMKSLCQELQEREKELMHQTKVWKTNVKECKRELKAKANQLAEQQQFQVGLQESFIRKDELIAKLKRDLESRDQADCEKMENITAQNRKLEEELQSSKENAEKLKKEMNELSRQNSLLQEEIGKIKSNAKEIIESKQRLKEELQNWDARAKNLVKVGQLLKNKVKQQKDSGTFPNYSELKEVLLDKNTKAMVAPEIEELVAFLHESYSDEIKNFKNQLKKSQQKYSELEERIKSRDVSAQELRTEVIALEEKLKSKEKNEKELKEELAVSEEVNNSLKEQLQKMKCELRDLKTSLNSMKTKHEETIESLYKQLEIRESQLDESLMNTTSQHNSTNQELIKARSEISKLQAQVETLSALSRDMTAKLKTAAEDNSEQIGKLTKQYESQIEALQSKLDEKNLEVTEKMDQLDNMEDRLAKKYMEIISKMQSEISEKNNALEEVHTYYQYRLKAKENELKHLNEQLTSTDRDNYQINALQNSILQYHEENLRLKELLNMQHETKTGANQVEQHGGGGSSRNRVDSDMESCAILGVHLPQPTEYEYLRNILFEFMCGREPVTLAKVIAAVMRFSNEQTEQIIRRQESIHSSASAPAPNHHGHHHHKLPK